MHGLDWFDLGARRYDAKVASFTSVDPLSEKFYHISPYSYCAGDPVNKIDPNGENPILCALAGAGLDVALQMTTQIMQGQSFFEALDNLDGKSVLISAAAGAAGAGLVSKVKQVSKIAKIGKTAMVATEAMTEAAVSGAESALKQLSTDGSVSVEQTVYDAGVGAIATGAGQFVKKVKQSSGSVEFKRLKRELDHAERVAGNNPRPSRQARVDEAKRSVENYGNIPNEIPKYFIGIYESVEYEKNK